MELISPSSPLLFPLILFLTLTAIILIKKHRRLEACPIPPGPWKLPIIGSIHHLAGKPAHQILRDLSTKHGPVMHLKLGEVDWVVISSPDAAREVTKTNDLKFASRPELLTTKIAGYNGSGPAFSPYGPYWRQVRKICVIELLNSNRVRSFRPIMEEESQKLMNAISLNATNDGTVNLTEMIKSMAIATICRAAFSRASGCPKEFVNAADEISRLSSGFNLVDAFPSSKLIRAASTGKVRLIETLHKRVDSVLDRILEEHEGNAANSSEDEDLVDVLLRIQHNGELEVPLTRDNIKAVILDIFFGGTDTTSSILEWGMSELCRNPEMMVKSQLELRGVLKGRKKVDEGDINELHCLKLIVKETLRLHPPGPLLLPRLCRETCQVSGYTIHEGSRVAINVWAMGRDRKIWGDDAETFRPERFDEYSSVDFRGTSYEYLPFGAGRRMCPGIAFGLASVELALACLLLHFNWQLPNGMRPEDLDMSEAPGPVVKRKHDLILVAIPQSSSVF